MDETFAEPPNGYHNLFREETGLGMPDGEHVLSTKASPRFRLSYKNHFSSTVIRPSKNGLFRGSKRFEQMHAEASQLVSIRVEPISAANFRIVAFDFSLCSYSTAALKISSSSDILRAGADLSSRSKCLEENLSNQRLTVRSEGDSNPNVLVILGVASAAEC